MDDHYQYFNKAVELSKPQNNWHNLRHKKDHPNVGAVLTWNEGGKKKKATASHGEISLCDHAEYTLLERKLHGVNLQGKNATLYDTVEPCTERHLPDIPCSQLIVNRHITEVWLGILDPNPRIYGQSLWELRKNVSV